MVVKDVFMPEPKDINKVNQKQAITEMKQASEDIDVITQTMEKAAKVVGLSGKEQELAEARAAERKSRETLEQDRQSTLQGTIDSLGKKITETSSEDKAIIRDLGVKLEVAKSESTKLMFDTLTNKINDLEKMKVESAPTTDIAKQVKGIKEAFHELGLAGAQQASTSLPPEMLLRMKKMDFDMQESKEDRADERSRRDKEWQLTVRKWDEEKSYKSTELTIKAGAEKERNGMLMGIVQTIGETVAKATTVAPAEATTVTEKAQIRTTQKEAVSENKGEKPVGAVPVQVPEGQSGQFECVNCAGLVAVAEDAEGAMCAECETIYSVARVPA